MAAPFLTIAGTGPGLIVAGSYVAKTSRQLHRMLDEGLAEGFELRVARLRDAAQRRDEIDGLSGRINAKLRDGVATALYTSREMQASRQEEFAGIGKVIMRALCDVVARIDVCPAYMVAKGGITSIELARTALGARDALALGQILPGVPVWRLGTGARWPGMPYVVFPGNVGDETALAKAIRIMAAASDDYLPAAGDTP